MTEPATPTVETAELAVADALGRLMEFWGFKRAMGRVWSVLYLSPEPIGASEIATKLHMSAGAVSMTLADLFKWGTIRKTWRPGDRKDYYEAETSVVRLVARVLRERELRMIQEISDVLMAAERSLPRAKGREGRSVTVARDRIQRLHRLAKAGEAILKALVSGHLVDPSPLLRDSGAGFGGHEERTTGEMA